ncbi:glycosyltransferase family 2 protein [Bizionia sp.]|uniref:glycosyltransferase family 2 protein n=1 Tax=Bizionia sp. TaxID=1954480 RepID=UPI003A8DD088
MTLQPVVSIIIPTFNRAHLIGETLDSIVAQTYANWECLVVDDGSTDGTAGLLKAYIAKDSRFQYHKRPDSHLPGGNGARNYGFELSTGGYVIFFDSDDLLLPNALEARVSCIVTDSADMTVSESGVFIREIGDRDAVWNVIPHGTTPTDFLIRFFNVDMPWQTGGVTWKRGFLERCGLWHTRLIAWQDWELHSRALLYEPKLVVCGVHADNYYRHLSSDGIATTFKSLAYIQSMATAIISVSNDLIKKPDAYQELKPHYAVLVYYMLIKRPIMFGYVWFPLRYLFKVPFFNGLSRVQFFKIYMIELLARSTKIKRYILGDYYEKQQRYLTLTSTHLK